MNIMSLLVAKTIAENQGVPSDRALQLGLVASMMPPVTGMLVSLMIAQRETSSAKSAPSPAPAQPRVEDLYAQAKEQYAALEAQTEAVVASARKKLAAAQKTQAEQVLEPLVQSLLKLQRDELPKLDPARLREPIDKLVLALELLLASLAQYGLKLKNLDDQVSAVAIDTAFAKIPAA